MAGDYNAKHEFWGSRITLHKGRELKTAIDELQLNVSSTREPTYWPSDSKKNPDLVDFCVIKGIASNYINSESYFKLSSDHSPILITLTTTVMRKVTNCKLHNNKTNWQSFREMVSTNLNQKISFKIEDDITLAVEHFNECVQQAAWGSTSTKTEYTASLNCSPIIKNKINEKRKMRKLWQITRCPEIKKKLSYLIKEIKVLLNKETNEGIQNYLKKLDITAATNYSLRKATKNSSNLGSLPLPYLKQMVNGLEVKRKNLKHLPNICLQSLDLTQIWAR